MNCREQRAYAMYLVDAVISDLSHLLCVKITPSKRIDNTCSPSGNFVLSFLCRQLYKSLPLICFCPILIPHSFSPTENTVALQIKSNTAWLF